MITIFGSYEFAKKFDNNKNLISTGNSIKAQGGKSSFWMLNQEKGDIMMANQNYKLSQVFSKHELGVMEMIGCMLRKALDKYFDGKKNYQYTRNSKNRKRAESNTTFGYKKSIKKQMGAISNIYATL